MSLPSASAPAPRHAATATLDPRYRRVQHWAFTVLGLGTLALAAYALPLLVAAHLAGTVMEALTARQLTHLDLEAVASQVLPALLVGWCAGGAAAAVLARGDSMGPRAAGLASGGLGVAAGLVVLRVSGLV